MHPSTVKSPPSSPMVNIFSHLGYWLQRPSKVTFLPKIASELSERNMLLRSGQAVPTPSQADCFDLPRDYRRTGAWRGPESLCLIPLQDPARSGRTASEAPLRC